MAIASQLPKSCKVTIVARDLPGDEPSQDWASPWACAGWAAVAAHGGSPREQQMQLDALKFLRKLAASNPESSLRRAELTDVHDAEISGASGDLWYHGRLPNFQSLDPSTLSIHRTVKLGNASTYSSAILDPAIFLPWFRRELEASGVQFLRIASIKSLSELKVFGHDILINASGIASRTLTDTKDEHVVMDRHHIMIVKSDYDKMFVRRTASGDYVYIFGRQNGTAVIGGISDMPDSEIRPLEAVREEVRGSHDHGFERIL